jgi:hypothetical protein
MFKKEALSLVDGDDEVPSWLHSTLVMVLCGPLDQCYAV